MIKNILLAVVLMALGAVAAVAVINYKEEVSKQQAPQSYTWTFKDKGEEEGTGAPLTEVSLTYGDTTKIVGTYQGSCAVIDGATWKLLLGEKSGVICWFAGGGSEIGIFEENGQMVLKVGGVEEGDAETPGSRAGFKAVMSL
ncbi:MAG: hypothetical protein WC761_02535 [Candidatus Paceibacterota bacterium]|jgi:hypothetical protein